MRNPMRILAIAVAGLLSACGGTAAFAQRGPFSVAVEGGVTIPYGEWAEHRYAPDVLQVEAGPMVGGDLEVRPWSRIALALHGALTFHRTSQWEDYSASQGDPIEATVRSSQVLFALRPTVWAGEGYEIRLGFGVGWYRSNGEESFSSITYDYDFLRDVTAYGADLEFLWRLDERVDLGLRIGASIAPEGIRYADFVSRDVTSTAVAAGMRFYPF